MKYVLAVMVLALSYWPAALMAQDVITNEEAGTGDGPGTNPQPDPLARARALELLGTTGLLLIPESTNDRVMAFDAMTGDLVNADFIPADPDNLSTPICAIAGFDPDTILVSDQLDDVVQEYDALTGAYLGVFAPAGGADTSILDNIRGIAMSNNGTLLVTVGGGANASSVAEFDSSGNYLGNLVANGSGGLNSPFDVFLRSSDYLVGGITSDDILSYDLTGAFLSTLTPINTFPEQINMAANGNVLVANFSGTEEGLVEYTSTGTLVGIYDPPSLGGYRGIYELPNGNLLTTNGSGVHEVDRSGNLVETKISGVSARFIESLAPTIVCDPVIIQGQIGGTLTIFGTPGCIVDLYQACGPDPNTWTLLVSGIEIGENGSVVVTGLTVQQDACYLATVTGTQDPLNAPFRTVPTLGEYALIGFIVLLMLAGIFFLRRRRTA
jgi:hypothetical protein